MAETLDLSTTGEMLKAVARSVIDSLDELTNADLAIGDGDHGVGMRRGFEAALEGLEAASPASIDAAFKTVGNAILSQTGGAAGAVFGTLFRAGARALAGRPAIDADGFATFLESGLEAVIKRGRVTEGQKTMIDALAPAARAARQAVGQGLGEAASAAADAALQGVEATKAMVATTGKARSLGERSIGHPDPGAISIAIIMRAMHDFIVAV